MTVLDTNPIITTITNSPASDSVHQHAVKIVEGWIRRFLAQDELFHIERVEQELVLDIPGFDAVLVGRSDLITNDFFGEWKTGRLDKDWRIKWRMSAQALTYGLLLDRGVYTSGEKPPKVNRFLVRMAWKVREPNFDEETFTYSQAELNWWYDEVRGMITDIRRTQQEDYVPWQVNPGECFRYGKNYPCPYFENGCSKLQWTNAAGLLPRKYHLDIERSGQRAAGLQGLVLDATRIGAYLACREKYRKNYEENLVGPENENLQLGICVHAGLGEYYRQLGGLSGQDQKGE